MNRTHLLLCLAVTSFGVAWNSAAETTSSSLRPKHAAVLRTGDARQLRAALDRGLAVDTRDAKGNTPLMLAAVYGNVACMRLLLEHGADVNAANAAGATALMRAAHNYEKVRLLVERGADVNARSALGNTALMLATRPANSHRAVELLLARGANAKATNNWGATALMAAAASGDAKSVRALLKHGADVNAQNTPDQPGFIFGGGRTPLMWAAYRGNLEIMRLLIEAGADVNLEGALGTPLAQAAWADHTAAARLLIERGARVNQTSRTDDYTALHWAASTEERDASLVKLLLEHGADPNLGGGENVDAFLAVPQTPLMLARRRGDTPILSSLKAAGATAETPDRNPMPAAPSGKFSKTLDSAMVRSAMAKALPLLQETSIKSKDAFVNHASKQDCVSCHQQYLPMAAIGGAKKQNVSVDKKAEEQLIRMVGGGELKNADTDWQALFHPEAVHTKGYALLGWAAEDLPADEKVDSWVHHLATIQGKDGQWYNNLPRPPIQTGDIGATALAVHALQRYPLPGRKAEFANQVDRARRWLWTVKPENTEGRIYQILGLAWAGERTEKLQPLAKALLAEQRPDGGWAQLPDLKSDAYATGQAIYALRVGAALPGKDPAIERAKRFLLQTQLEDGSWHVRRRAFPFQPSMKSGFPHGKDSWISAAATSWAVMALSLPDETPKLARN